MAAAATVAVCATTLVAQDNGPAARFLAVDVHPSLPSISPEARAGFKGDRYTLRDMTMSAMIAAAYSMRASDVNGGPNWLDWNRYDVIAKLPPGTTPNTVRPMMEAMLRERFSLVAHKGSKPMPAFALTVWKGKSKLKAGDPAAPSECKSVQQPPSDGPQLYVEVSCVNESMDRIVQDLRSMAGAYVTEPVVDQTGLKGVWNFDIKWSPRNQLVQEGADGISFFDALEKQLGLHLEAATAPLPVIIVDSVNEKPTPNAADIEKVLPPLPPGEFEVAVIKPGKPDEQENGSISGDQMKLQGLTLDQLIRAVWRLPDDGPMLNGGPDWIRKDKWGMIAKAAKAAGDPELDEDDLFVMVQKLLEDRFKLAVHTEDKTMDAYNLVAVSPKMKKADPGERTRCFQGTLPGAKDPRQEHPELNKLRTCEGMTMAQFASTIQGQQPGYVKTPVIDKTGLEGAYDFTLSFTGAGKLKNPVAKAEGDAAADPGGGMSFFDAVQRELGLKLQPVRRPVSVLVIDHAEKPTEN
ncbi:MAG TPA: TIGR03435 family protein [Acidobacteriaceae bacterium]|nr:TIGR03435 family protein [Acidobacteriaceae bacterium]